MESASAVESSGRHPASRRSHVRAHLRTYAAALTDDDARRCVLCVFAFSVPLSPLFLPHSLFLSFSLFPQVELTLDAGASVATGNGIGHDGRK